MPEYFLSYEKEPLLDYWVLGSQDMHSGVQSIDSLGQTVPCIKYDETLSLYSMAINIHTMTLLLSLCNQQ